MSLSYLHTFVRIERLTFDIGPSTIINVHKKNGPASAAILAIKTDFQGIFFKCNSSDHPCNRVHLYHAGFLSTYRGGCHIQVLGFGCNTGKSLLWVPGCHKNYSDDLLIHISFANHPPKRIDVRPYPPRTARAIFLRYHLHASNHPTNADQSTDHHCSSTLTWAGYGKHFSKTHWFFSSLGRSISIWLTRGGGGTRHCH